MAFAVSPLKDGKVFLYDGHQRYSSWLTVYGEDYEVDARQSDIFLTEEERLEFVVTMHAGATGSWDWQKLSSFPAPKLIEMGFDNELKKQYDFDALNLREMLGSEEILPTLDELAEQYGETGERDFYPVIRVQVSPETFTKYNALMKDMIGADDAEKFDALISRGG